MKSATNIFFRRTPPVHSGIRAQNKRQYQKEQGERNTSGQVQSKSIHPQEIILTMN